ncbi:hypothetical protein [Kineothrix sp. MB12-C1]|uniref:hypothetical protein n=1 Tax=Kineothrix sp. MB12-C1 TaxID=3070215 RepID=UPI0027D1F8C0|nr:hypothetical protein [Kineothrix sp. MB12-C1]WMC91267.1 hypothetical protein RBB56_10260 [Kineothrix sp. MB12-C1]
MNKIYSRINWENYPSEKTPVNEANLNKIDYATNEIDNRVISLDTSKLDKTTANGMVKNVTYNSTNGVFTVTYLNGTTASIDTKLEKMAVNFVYDAENERLVITLDDGTKQYVDMKSLITQYEFNSSDTISFTISSEGKVQAEVKNGSITSDKLQPNYLADITVQAGIAQTSAGNAENSADLAETYAIRAEEAAEHAENVSDVQVMTPTQIGIGKPDNITIGVSNGTFYTKFKNYTSLADLGLTAPKTCLEIATAMGNNSQITMSISETTPTVTDIPDTSGSITIEKVTGFRSYAHFNAFTGGTSPQRVYVRYIRPEHNAISDWTEYLTTSKLTNNLLATVPGTALDAVQGKELDTRVTTNTNDIDTLNQKLDKTNLKSNSNLLTVGKVGAQYTTINAAINYAKTYASKTNRVAILIYEGTYGEEITLNDNPGIDLVGIQGQTIIRYASAYPNAPLYTCGQGYFYGITFQSTGGTNSYAMHFERQGFTSASGETVFSRCRFISDTNASVGVGMGNSNTVEFRDCTFIGLGTGTKAIYAHNYPTAATNQNMRFINNHIVGHINIDDAPLVVGNGVVDSPMALQFFNNYSENGNFYFKQATNGNLPYIPVDQHNISLHSNSANNTLIALNRREYGSYYYGYSKPSSKIPNSSYTDYFIPLINADKYSITVDSAVIQGVGDYDKTKYSTPLKTSGGFLLRDTGDAGTGNFITVNFTILPL